MIDITLRYRPPPISMRASTSGITLHHMLLSSADEVIESYVSLQVMSPRLKFSDYRAALGLDRNTLAGRR
jgi:hypothetical protein